MAIDQKWRRRFFKIQKNPRHFGEHFFTKESEQSRCFFNNKLWLGWGAWVMGLWLGRLGYGNPLDVGRRARGLGRKPRKVTRTEGSLYIDPYRIPKNQTIGWGQEKGCSTL